MIKEYKAVQIHLHSNMVKFKLIFRLFLFSEKEDLHSNMVKFKCTSTAYFAKPCHNLHSNMVKFKLTGSNTSAKKFPKFTFQYG